MKYLIILLFVSVSCFGQHYEKYDSVPAKYSGTNFTGDLSKVDSISLNKDSTYFINYTLIQDSTIQTTDTISCVMLVSDTSLQFYNNSDCINCPRKGYDNFTYWQKGYEVRNSNSIYAKYLDADKKPLSKNIIAWLSKTLK